jgi:CRP-like cAMP-binding protein
VTLCRVSGAQFEETLASASPDVLRAMVREFAQRMMDADVEVACKLWNEGARSSKWTKTADQIIDRICRYCSRISQLAH